MGKDVEAIAVGTTDGVVYGAVHSSNEDLKIPSSGSSQFSKYSTDNVPGRSQIGVVSAVFIIFNRMIGTGIFATPSTILSLSGSVGMSL